MRLKNFTAPDCFISFLSTFYSGNGRKKKQNKKIIKKDQKNTDSNKRSVELVKRRY